MWLWRIIIALLIIFLAEFYFVKKVTNAANFLFPSLNENKRKKWTVVFLIIINLYPLYLLSAWGFSAMGGKMVFIPESSLFDYLIIFPFWIWIFLVAQCILIFLLSDIIKLLLFPLYKKKKFKEKLRRGEAKFVVVLVAFFIIYIPARVLYDYYTVSIRITEYKNSSLPDALNNFKLVLISDIHADEFTNDARLERFIKKINSTNPDLVLIGGDFISSTPDYIETAAKYVGNIKSKYGVYSCVGDHDNWAYRNDVSRSLREVMQALQKHHVEMINNEQKTINVNGAKISIAFITNTYVERINETRFDKAIGNGLPGDLKILLVHQPSNFLVEKAKENNFNLLLAGHTHGGQVTFLFPFKNLSPTLIETNYVRGDFHFGNLLMVVTRGLGMSLVPLRYNSTPEVTVIMINPS
jgi:uncharacterized protein